MHQYFGKANPCAAQFRILVMMRRARQVIAALAAVSGGCAVYVATHDVYNGILGNYVRSLDAEDAHRLGVRLAKYRVAAPGLRFFAPKDAEELRTCVFGFDFNNPIGLAAGFDKQGEAIHGLFALGFGFVEVGTVTPLPQPGNPRPRVFRLLEDNAVINRYGFNSDGVTTVRKRLFRYDSGGRNADRVGILGVNLGKNKSTPQEHAVDDYMTGLKQLGDLAEYIVINVSSPNTPGLRDLQGPEQLRALLSPLLQARSKLMYRPPILVKIAPDLSPQDMKDIAQVVTELPVDGLIVTNATVQREGLELKSIHAQEKGGLSGRPLEKLSTECVREMYKLTEGRIPIIGVGGVESGEDAYRKIRAGASLVQLYTALVYHGPWLIDRVKKELRECLRRDGYKNVTEAVGADHRMQALSKPP